MSYTIEYDRLFIRSNEGITPMVLMGPSNCYDSPNGRWRRERSWDCFCGLLGVSESEFMAYIEQMKNANNEYSPNGTHWMRNGSFLTDDGIVRWARSGIKNAKTIEEICEVNPYLSLEFRLVNGNETKILESEYIRSTDGVDKWIRKVRDAKANCYIRFTEESVTKPKELCDGYSYAIKFSGKYVTDMKAHENTDGTIEVTSVTTHNGEEPWFFTAQDAKRICAGINKKNFSGKAQPVRFTDSEREEKAFIIRAGTEEGRGRYIVKVTSRRVFLSPYASDAKKYTKTSVNAAVERLKKRSFQNTSGFHAEKVEEKT